MVNPEHMNLGYEFAYAFQSAFFRVAQQHPGLHIYIVQGLNENTAFVLANGAREMLIDTKARRSHGGNLAWFGINAQEWLGWQNPGPYRVLAREVQHGGHDLQYAAIFPHEVPAVAILAYAGYRPVDQCRLFAQWVPHIGVGHQAGEFADTDLGTYARLHTVLEQGLGIEEELALVIEERTLANALQNQRLNPH